ncbi:MAG: hypothetical protein KDA41_05665, partial [Planctomycetales bacterium]|nr:hypothetical protein [Planctomycetales bacterium]
LLDRFAQYKADFDTQIANGFGDPATALGLIFAAADVVADSSLAGAPKTVDLQGFLDSYDAQRGPITIDVAPALADPAAFAARHKEALGDAVEQHREAMDATWQTALGLIKIALAAQTGGAGAAALGLASAATEGTE